MRYAIALNTKHPLGTQLNALGHVCVGLAHLAGTGNQSMRLFVDKTDSAVGLMSDDPLIVLSAQNSSQLKKSAKAAVSVGILTNVFVIDMREGDPVDQERVVGEHFVDDLDHVAVGFWGEEPLIRELTRRFSLYRL